MNNPPPQKKTNGKQKENKRNNVRQQRQITPLQRRRCIKRNTSIRTPHGKIPPPKQNSHETSKKNPCFPLFFGHPGGVGKFLRIIRARQPKPKTKKQKNGPKNKTPKSGKRYFSPDFLMVPKARVNKRSGGGRFFDTARSKTIFFTPFLGGPISKAECTQTILYYKNRGFGTFWGPKKWAKI